MSLPTTDSERKRLPIFNGFLMYFPDAIAAVAYVSQVGNDQHNPGEPLHWARGKSMDQMNTAIRHMMDHGSGVTHDTDGTWHLAKAAWRTLAALQLAIEANRPIEVNRL
jgi:dATP/dGTP diphosphohydrolase